MQWQTMQTGRTGQAGEPGRGRLRVGLAANAREIEAAQRLRYRVFAGEMGARLDAARQIDRDAFDPYCEHLVVKDVHGDRIVGTYRILAPQGACAAGGYYSEQEFDISALDPLRDGLVEAGRACVHPAYRAGAVVLLLWAGLARYMNMHGYSHLFGCASIPLSDGGHAAARLWQRVLASRQAPGWRVVPRCRLPVAQPAWQDGDRDGGDSAGPALPPLLRGYLNAGARVCGEPAWDPDFNTADVPVLLRMHELNARHRRRFGSTPGG